MCGFAFYFDVNIEERIATQRMQNALGRLYFRGPDEQNIYHQPPIFSGHTRLSIVDLSDSHQPMVSEDGRYILLFNGEIYNYKKLRIDLEDRWRFITQGDTEVLLAGLILEGIGFLSRLEGMWSFAFWDSAFERLILSRDRMGKKPLFYFLKGNILGCASELPALECLAGSPWSVDIDSMADYFRYGYCLPGYTAWKGVYEVLPAHCLVWEPGKEIANFPYWELKLQDAANSDEVTDHDLRTALSDAVAKRLEADVEVGAFLSGGIDSSLVCRLAQSMLDCTLKTYTIGFSDKSFDESMYANSVAKSLGTDHHCELFNSWDEKLLEHLLSSHFGQPFGDVSVLPTALVSRVAAKEVKVVLSGDGADEIFGGYQRYQARLILRWYSRLPKGLRSAAEKIILSLPEPMVHHSRSWLKKAQLFCEASKRQSTEIPYVAPTLFSADEFANLFPPLVGKGHDLCGFQEETQLDDIQRMLCSDTSVYLPQDILTKVDRASMAYSLETRSPFLDHKVVELAFRREAREHVRIGRGKLWLREAFSSDLPHDVWKRKKQGFGVPVHDWFRHELGERFESMLKTNPGFIQRLPAMALLTEHRSFKRDNGHKLWAMYVYLVGLANS